MARLSSSSDIFARRGDPWVTRREGIEDFGRKALVTFEDPDLDQFTQAEKAPKRFEPGPDKPIRVKSTCPDVARRKASILNKMRRKMRGGMNVTKDKSVNPNVAANGRPYDALRKFDGSGLDKEVVPKKTGYTVYILLTNGKEIEEDRTKYLSANRLFSKHKVSPETVVAELWDSNGTMIASLDKRKDVK